MLKLIALSLLCLGLACSKKPAETKSSFVISLADLSAGMTFAGGGLLQIKNSTTGESHSYEMITTNVIALPNGTWDMFFVGFQGTAAWQGPYVCGGTSGIELTGADATVDITATPENCSNSIFVALIASKGGALVGAEWNASDAKWEDPGVKWGP